MTEPERLYGRLFYRTATAWGPLITFRRTAAIGLQAALPRLQRDASAGVDWLLSGEMEHIFVDKAAFIAAQAPDVLRAQMYQANLRDFTATVDAASLVFAHSILEELAMDAIRVALAVAPADFHPRVANKTAKLTEFLTRGIDAVVTEKLHEWLEQVGRESLLRKVDLLYELTRPPTGFRPLLNDYVYERARLETFDAARHKVVHELAPPAIQGAILDGEIAYLGDTSRSFVALLHQRYGLRVHPHGPSTFMMDS